VLHTNFPLCVGRPRSALDFLTRPRYRRGHDNTDKQREPTADELAGMQWWNNLTEPQRADALKAASTAGDVSAEIDFLGTVTLSSPP
jgi:hypothetical protein